MLRVQRSHSRWHVSIGWPFHARDSGACYTCSPDAGAADACTIDSGQYDPTGTNSTSSNARSSGSHRFGVRGEARRTGSVYALPHNSAGSSTRGYASESASAEYAATSGSCTWRIVAPTSSHAAHRVASDRDRDARNAGYEFRHAVAPASRAHDGGAGSGAFTCADDGISGSHRRCSLGAAGNSALISDACHARSVELECSCCACTHWRLRLTGSWHATPDQPVPCSRPESPRNAACSRSRFRYGRVLSGEAC